MSHRSTKYTPILFSTSLVQLAEGASQILDMDAMSSPFRRPMWVDEIRWEYVGPPGTPGFNFASSIRCKLTLGRIAMTGTRDGGGFVPIWSFGPPLNTPSATEFVLDATFDSIDPYGFDIGHFRWKLPKPLYVPAGQSLIPSLMRQVDGLGGVVRTTVAVVGRQLGDANQEMPKTIDVPYVAYYEPPIGAASAISSELDIVNPFLVPLNVQRMICRQFQVDDQYGEAPGDGSGLGGNATYDDIANVAIKDSWGNNVVRDIVDLGSVFDPLRRGWTFMRVLNPKERYVIQLSSIFQPAGLSPTEGPNYAQPQISMIGYRTEVFK